MKNKTNDQRKEIAIQNKKENDRMYKKYAEIFNESNLEMRNHFEEVLDRMADTVHYNDFDINSIPDIDYLKEMLDKNQVYLYDFGLHIALTKKGTYEVFSSQISFTAWSWDDLRISLEEMRVTHYDETEAEKFTKALSLLIKETMNANSYIPKPTDQVSNLMSHVLHSKAEACANVDNMMAVKLEIEKDITCKKTSLENLQYQRMSFTDNIRRLDAWLIILHERAVRLDFMGDTSDYAKSVEKEFEHYLECKRNAQVELDALLKTYQDIQDDIDALKGLALQFGEGAALNHKQIEDQYQKMVDALVLCNEIQHAMEAGVPICFELESELNN
ncbi:MAG: hypothetical protein ACRC0V_10965 [Fusobacteriaceae bacterium]